MQHLPIPPFRSSQSAAHQFSRHRCFVANIIKRLIAEKNQEIETSPSHLFEQFKQFSNKHDIFELQAQGVNLTYDNTFGGEVNDPDANDPKANDPAANDPEAIIESADLHLPEVAVFDEDTAKLLGESAASSEGSFTFHAELSNRVKQWMQDGIRKDDKINLFRTYPRKGSVFLEAPTLNPEIEATVSDTVRKRDKFCAADQNIVGSAISAIGVGLSLLLVKKNFDKDDRDMLIKYELDAMKLLSEVHLQATKTRRVYIYLVWLVIEAIFSGQKAIFESFLSGKLAWPVWQEFKFSSGGQQIQKQLPAISIEEPRLSENTGSVSSSSQCIKPPSKIVTVSKLAGRLKSLLSAWSNITSDKFVLDVIKGYKLKFINPPHQSVIPKIPIDKSVEFDYKEAINNLVELDIRTAIKLLSQDSFMAKLDLQDAYFMISIHPDSRKYLRFIWKDQLYEFVCLPSGLCTAPLIFTKIMKPVAHCLREEGRILVVYLDDWLCFGSDFHSCSRNILRTVELLEFLGLIINYRKSILVPKNRYEFLGFVLDSKTLTLELPERKRDKMLGLIREFKSKNVCKIREFAQFVGNITACCPAVEYSWVYSKFFERQRYLALVKNHDNYDARMFVTKDIQDDFVWWERNITQTSNSIKTFNFKKGNFLMHQLLVGEHTWCEARQLWIYASYIASKENIEANRGSRVRNADTKWELSPDVFNRINNHWGTFQIDLFASRNNAKCCMYCSWHRDPEAFSIDAFTLD
ncbi:uncharacterized protein LOC124409394 [Diprion similis]|uniref:uncharacterized protein LOC124409394 n=1 Tax=Diprion similis TaxID=362088 RepID=UPI001EF939A2|nr:uncharacterized protein LOC124409394 [Diprion similis]